MADDRLREEIVTKFFLNTCQLRRPLNDYDVYGWRCCAALVQRHAV